MAWLRRTPGAFELMGNLRSSELRPAWPRFGSLISEGVLTDVRLEGRCVHVAALPYEHGAAAGVEEDRRRPAGAGADRARLVGALVENARVVDRVFVEEVLGRGTSVAGVEAEEGDAVLVFLGQLLEEGELRPAWGTPGGPLIDDHGDSAQFRELRVQRRVDQRIPLAEVGFDLRRRLARSGGGPGCRSRIPRLLEDRRVRARRDREHDEGADRDNERDHAGPKPATAVRRLVLVLHTWPSDVRPGETADGSGSAGTDQRTSHTGHGRPVFGARAAMDPRQAPFRINHCVTAELQRVPL